MWSLDGLRNDVFLRYLRILRSAEERKHTVTHYGGWKVGRLVCCVRCQIRHNVELASKVQRFLFEACEVLIVVVLCSRCMRCGFVNAYPSDFSTILQMVTMGRNKYKVW
jgi:hypothetical protein